MALQVAMKSAAAELWDCLPQAAHDVIERKQTTALKLDDDGLLSLRQYGAMRLTWPHGASAVICWVRHLAAVLRFRLYWAARARGDACAAWSSARTRGVVRVSREHLLP
jgi:hypothetical protein